MGSGFIVAMTRDSSSGEASRGSGNPLYTSKL